MLFVCMDAHAQSFTVENLRYSVLSAAEQTVKVVALTDDAEEVDIPASVDYRDKTYAVTIIDEAAFKGSQSLVRVSIPESVVAYGRICFADCPVLTDVTLSPNAKSLAVGMFSSCKALQEITIPEGVTEVQQQAFWSCAALENVTFGSTVSTFGLACFEFCSALKEIALPTAVRELPREMFAFCTALQTVGLSEGLENIDDFAFELCHDLQNVTLPESLQRIGASAFIADTCLTHVYISPNVTEIGERAFGSTKGLEAFEVAGENASFASVDGVLYSKDLTTLLAYPNAKAIAEPDFVVPTSVETIAPSAFYGADKVEHILLPDGLNSIGSWAFWSARALQDITLPEGITTVTEGMLRDCTALQQVSLPSTLTTIESQGLSGCAAMEHIDLPESLTSVAMLAFNTCLTLRDITIPDGVEELPLMCFNGCLALEKVVLGKGVSSFGPNAFANDNNIREVYSLNTVPPVSASFTEQTYGQATLYVPGESLSAYQSADGWSDFSHIEVMNGNPDGITHPDTFRSSTAAHFSVSGTPVVSGYRGIHIVDGRKVILKE